MSEHTTTPWFVDVLGYLRGPNRENILEIKENAEFVVTAVNSYAKNQETIRELLEAGNNIEDILEVPTLLGDSSKLTVSKAIKRFRCALKKSESQLDMYKKP